MAKETITITLSDKEDIDWIRDKVRDGRFASATEAIAQGISLMREGEIFETWMRDEIAERYEDLKLHPETAIPLDQVVKNLEQRRSKRATLSR